MEWDGVGPGSARGDDHFWKAGVGGTMSAVDCETPPTSDAVLVRKSLQSFILSFDNCLVVRVSDHLFHVFPKCFVAGK